MKQFCDKLKKRICLQKSCAEWLDNFKSVRRAFRVGSFCSWASAEDKRKASEASRAGSSQAAKRHQPLLATLEHAGDNGSKAKETMTAPPRKSQPKKCTGCGELATRAPRRTHLAVVTSSWHTKYGWCPKKQLFVTASNCPECGNNRAEDSANHQANGYCLRSNSFPGQGSRGKQVSEQASALI